MQAAWRIWLSKREETAALRAWAQLLARRRSPRIAIVALARRIARILFGMGRDGSDYQPPYRRADTTAQAQAVTPVATVSV